MSKARVFIVESPNPLDLLEERGERFALEQVCKLVGHDAATFLVRDRSEFLQTCAYISSIKGKKTDKTPLFLHISVHGNETGIAVGRDTVGWQDLAKATQNMYDHLKYYHGPVVLVFSACGANKQKLTSELTKSRRTTAATFVPPEYVFVFSDDTVLWIDAVVTWTIFYREAVKLDFTNRRAVQKLLDRLRTSGFGNLRYHRWDTTDQEYKFYPTRK